MASKKPRFLTDSLSKKQQALMLLEKEALIAERKKHQRAYKMRSDDTKVEVVKTYLALGGNLTMTATVTEISRDTLKVWKASSWWKNIVAEIQKQEKLELSAKTKRILEKTMEVLADRVMNGDYLYDHRKGTLIRKPISADTAHKISTDLIDRSEILNKVQEDEGDEKSTDIARLSDLAKRFELLANKQEQQLANKPAVEVTDVIYINEETQEVNDATNEKREA